MASSGNPGTPERSDDQAAAFAATLTKHHAEHNREDIARLIALGAHTFPCYPHGHKTPGEKEKAPIYGWRWLERKARSEQEFPAVSTPGVRPCSVNLVVVDVDLPDHLKGKHNAEAAAELHRRVGEVWDVMSAPIGDWIPTPSGGAHMLYPSAGLSEADTKNGDVPGIGQVRGSNGYALVYNALKWAVAAAKAKTTRPIDRDAWLRLRSRQDPHAAKTNGTKPAAALNGNGDLYARVAAATPGSRNTIMSQTVYHLVSRGWWKPQSRLQVIELYAKAQGASLDMGDIVRHVDAAAETARKKVAGEGGGAVAQLMAAPKPPASVTGAPAPAPAPVPSTNLAPGGNPHLGDGLFSDLFIARHGDDFRFDFTRNESAGAWVEWRGGTWKRLSGPPLLAATDVIRAKCSEEETDAKVKQATRTFDTSTHKRGTLQGIREKCLRKEWDKDPHLLGLPNGLCADIRTGDVREQRREDHITLHTPVMPAENSGEFLDLLLQTGRGDASWVDYVMTIAVDCATGEAGEHLLVIAKGAPGTGKSTIFGSFAAALGTYARDIFAERLMVTQHPAHLAWLAALDGARMAVSSELPKSCTWNGPLVSKITGGDMVSANFMRGNLFDFRPQFRLTALCNDLPKMPSGESGLKRRARVIPFENAVMSDRDTTIQQYYHGAGRGQVLRAILDAARVVNARPASGRYPHCQRIAEATTAYTQVIDPIQLWCDLYLERDPEAQFANSDALDCYNLWAQKAGERTLKRTGFGRALSSRMAPVEPGRDVKDSQGRQAIGYKGWRIRLKPAIDR